MSGDFEVRFNSKFDKSKVKKSKVDNLEPASSAFDMTGERPQDLIDMSDDFEVLFPKLTI
jgi:hypothetical protein